MEINTGQQELTVGTDPVLLSERKLSGYGERVRLILVNTGATNFRIGVDKTPGTSLGIPLFPGGSIEWEKIGSVPIQQKQVLGVSSGAGGTISIYEEIAQGV